MSVRASRMVVPIGALIIFFGGLSGWFFWSRPTLDGVLRQITTGQYRAAEAKLREYLRTYPRDEQAKLWLARALVERGEPEPDEALRLIEGLRPADTQQAALLKSIEGEANFWKGRYDKAEPAWLEALRLEPTIPEVGWKLLNIYAIQERTEDSTRLALRLFATEPDPRDRVQLLLQLLRPDAHPNEPGSIVHQLEPVVRENPGDFYSTLALGGALIRSGRNDPGMGLLRRAVDSHGESPTAWAAYLNGLVETANFDELVEAIQKLPRAVAVTAQAEAAKGWLAAQRLELDEAARAYRRALEARPSSGPIAFRYKVLLRRSAKAGELAEISPRLDAIARFPEKALDLSNRISELPDLGLRTHPEYFTEAAAALVEVCRKEEAVAWEQLARNHGPSSP